MCSIVRIATYACALSVSHNESFISESRRKILVIVINTYIKQGHSITIGIYEFIIIYFFLLFYIVL